MINATPDPASAFRRREMKAVRRMVAAAAGGILIVFLFLWLYSRNTPPPLGVEVRLEGPLVLHEMATISLLVSNPTSRALRCWVAAIEAKDKSQQLHLESGLGLLSFGAPWTNLQSGASAQLGVPVPFGCRGEFRIQVGYDRNGNHPIGRWNNRLASLPGVGRWLSKAWQGYGVVSTDWMRVPNKTTGVNAGGRG